MADPSAPPSYDAAVNDQKDPKFESHQTAPYPPQPYPAQPYPPAATQPGYPSTAAQPPYPSTGAQPYGQPYPQSYPQAEPFHASYQASPQTYNANDTGNSGFSARGTFDDQSVRRLFIRKVYITLGLQLLVTFGIVCVFTFIPVVGDTVKKNPAMYYVAYGVFLVLYITLVCCGDVRRKSPMNIILLILFTLALSYMVGTIASFYSTQSVLVALGITVGVCLAVTLFSMQTKFDFTKCSGLLFVLVLVLMLFGFVTIFTYRYNWYLQVVYGALGALVFTLFLAFDTQLIMGGKRYELDPEEYIYGALNLYIDVVYIFIFILSLVGGSK